MLDQERLRPSISLQIDLRVLVDHIFLLDLRKVESGIQIIEGCLFSVKIRDTVVNCFHFE